MNDLVDRKSGLPPTEKRNKTNGFVNLPYRIERILYRQKFWSSRSKRLSVQIWSYSFDLTRIWYGSHNQVFNAFQ